MRAYVAGPMSGIPQFNFPAFDAAATDLRARGVDVVSPAELDDPDVRELVMASEDGASLGDGPSWEECLARDLKMVVDVDAIVVLPGWERSRGAQLEVDVARRLNKQILAYPNLAPVGSEEVRVVNAETGGEKGSKPARFDLVPWYELWRVAELYGRGAAKYAPRNWEAGYAWSLSFSAMHRHLAQFWGGEGEDPETGCHHLASVVFHALALMHFDRHHPDLDDRPGHLALDDFS